MDGNESRIRWSGRHVHPLALSLERLKESNRHELYHQPQDDNEHVRGRDQAGHERVAQHAEVACEA
jgi:hypothetical protein